MATIPFEMKSKLSPTIASTESLDVPPRPANLMTAGLQLVTQTMGEIVTKQMDFMRAEGGEIAKSAAALGKPGGSIEAAQSYAAAIRGGAEAGFANLREIQVLSRDCAWGLLGIYMDTMSETAGNGRVSAFTRNW